MGKTTLTLDNTILMKHIFQSPWLHGENGKKVVILVPIFKEDLKSEGNFRQFNLEKAFKKASLVKMLIFW